MYKILNLVLGKYVTKYMNGSGGPVLIESKETLKIYVWSWQGGSSSINANIHINSKIEDFELIPFDNEEQNV